jgi:hypothetical protein
MSNVRDPERDQVAPTPNDKPAVWLAVIDDMQERHQHGVKKYGTPLQPHNGRNALRDIYEELLDAAVYAKQRLIEEEGVMLSRDDAKTLACAARYLATATFIIEDEGGDEEDVRDSREVATAASDVLIRAGIMCPGCHRCDDLAESPQDGSATGSSQWYRHTTHCPGFCDEACQGTVVVGKPCDGSGLK